MKKWLVIFVFAFCLYVAAAFVIKHLKQKKNTETATIAYTPSTWSRFGEYKRLEMLLKGFAVESIIDIPCLDLQELKQQHFDLKRYIGVAESKDQALALQAQFGNELRSFLNAEIAIDMLPRVDLILCWDKLSTMPQSQARSALVQFKKSGAKYLLMRHYPEVKKNHKNKASLFQPINWKLPPYNFPEPIIQIIENKEHGMECLALWSLESI